MKKNKIIYILVGIIICSSCANQSENENESIISIKKVIIDFVDNAPFDVSSKITFELATSLIDSLEFNNQKFNEFNKNINNWIYYKYDNDSLELYPIIFKLSQSSKDTIILNVIKIHLFRSAAYVIKDIFLKNSEFFNKDFVLTSKGLINTGNENYFIIEKNNNFTIEYMYNGKSVTLDDTEIVNKKVSPPLILDE